MADDAERDAEILRTFRKQAETCTAMGSPIYGDLLTRCADDFAAGGLVADLISGWNGHPVLDNVPLRLMGAAHFLALRGDASALAACLPSTGGRYERVRAWDRIVQVFDGP